MTLCRWEQQIVDEVSSENLRQVTASIAQWVRLSGSAAEREALLYVQRLLDEYGLETQLIIHDAYISLPGEAVVEMESGDRLPCITHSFAAPAGPRGRTGDLVEWGHEASDVAGKIALIEGLTMPALVMRVEAAGAIAQIYVHGNLTHEMIVSPVWGNPDHSARARLPRTPIVSVDEETGVKLRAALAGGRTVLRIRADVDTRWRQTPILLASLKASGTDDFVLLSGHIDSWHLGAMDNGSANATMVEVGRILAGHSERLRRGLRLAFWSGHSHGRYSGSAWFADNYWLDLRKHCVAHVNVDSLGGMGATVLSEGIAMASTHDIGAGAIGDITGATFHGSRVGRAGDQSFVGLGVPSLWMSLSEQPPSSDPTAAGFAQLVGESRSGGLGWWWHTTEDTIDKIDPQLLLHDARIYTLAVGRLLVEQLLPLDAAAEAGELLGLLRRLPPTSIDLSEVIELARSLVRKAEELESWKRDKGEQATASEISEFNKAVTGILREIVPINYTMAGPFGHDPALTVPPLPSLQALEELATLDPESDDARFLQVELTRQRNRVLEALDRGLQAARFP
jgi:Peptidase family M28